MPENETREDLLARQNEAYRRELADFRVRDAVLNAVGDIVPEERQSYLLQDARREFDWDFDEDRLVERGTTLNADLNYFRRRVAENKILVPGDDQAGRSKGKKKISKREFRYEISGNPELLRAVQAGEIEVED